MTDIRDKIDEALTILSQSIAQEAMVTTGPNVLSFDQKLSAFKSLAAYRVMVNKINPPKPQGSKFDEYRSQITVSGSRPAGTSRRARAASSTESGTTGGFPAYVPADADAERPAAADSADSDPGEFAAFFE